MDLKFFAANYQGAVYATVNLVALPAAICATLAISWNSSMAQRRRTVEVPKEIVQQLLRDEELKTMLVLRPDGSAKNLVAEPIDLNRDGQPELEVHGIDEICGANNCVTWIYQKTGNHYRMLLDADVISHIESQKTFTHGYRDIMTAFHESASDSDLVLYKFDGKRYRRAGCFYRTYRLKDRHGVYRDSQRPKITRTKCESEQ